MKNYICEFTVKCGSSFEGTIISVYSAEKGLFYALNSANYDKFRTIDQHKPEVVYNKAEDIKFGEIFVYFDNKRNSYSRAYRLNSSPANLCWIRAFLIDIGIEIYEIFKKGIFFLLPEQFNYDQPMAIFCMLDSFPAREDVEMKSVFLKKTIYRWMKFNVKREVKVKNSLGSNQLSLLIDVEKVECEDGEGLCEQQEPQENEFNSSELSFMVGTGDEHVPFPVSFIPHDPKLPEPGTTIIIYVTEVLNPWSLYVRYNKQENFTNDYCSELLSVELLMNDDKTVDRYVNLRSDPVVGEMVITIGRDRRYHRGVVEAVTGNSCKVSVKSFSAVSFDLTIPQVFFVDFGYTLPIDFKQIFMFPRECAVLPFQAVHLTISGMTTFGDSKSDSKAVQIMSKSLPCAMAVVE